MQRPTLFLRKHEERRLRKGHLWIFSNEIDVRRSPLDTFRPGDLVNVIGADGKPLGSAYINPHTLICARLLSGATDLNLDARFFRARLTAAQTLRERLFDRPFYRLVYGESDGLPGVVVDRFGDVLAVQITTAGIERHKEALLDALIEQFRPEAIVLKNDNSQRQLEGLALENTVVYGTMPETLIIEENNARFVIDILKGQKTGWFYDHRDSRTRCARLSTGRTLLDLFCYSGAWGIPAASAGAEAVTCVDASEAALALAADNARLNRVETKLNFIKSDVFEFLKLAAQEKRRYDIIVLDPPALIKRKKDFKAGLEAYRRLNQLALHLLEPQGILVSASCSHHLSRDNLHELLRASARRCDRHLMFIAGGGQGPDHPIHPSITETEYLKTFFCAVTPSL